jgi:hypothetical protein
LPALLAEVTHAGNVAPNIGIMTALYAAVQFVFASVRGAWLSVVAVYGVVMVGRRR